ncbi:MAG: FAD-dependent oxidoreductase [Elusimicrobia bacterium]|nr:FAD-dependent oxidoreductase [Elusimicrobiota bacterium]
MLDILIIGGGITGAGILWEATRRGLKAALFEMREPAGQTTGISSGLIHGGLRYLPYDFPTTRLCCQEAAQVRRLAPHLLSRQIFLWPAFKCQWTGPELIETVIEAYDGVSALKGGCAHVRLSKEETLKIEPGIKKTGLLGALTFDEWNVNPRELVMFLLNGARERGAAWESQAKIVNFTRENNRITGVAVVKSGLLPKVDVPARMVINATGPWAQATAALAGTSSVQLTLRRGSHMIIPRQNVRHAVLFQDSTGRFIGAYPKGESLWIGPTDEPFPGAPQECRVTGEEMVRLSDAARNIFPGTNLTQARFISGVRPILRQKGAGAFLTRDYRLFNHGALDGIEGLLTITGGKMTVFRKMAEETLDLAESLLKSAPGSGSPVKFRHHSKNLTVYKIFSLFYSLVRLGYFTGRHFLVKIGRTRQSGIQTFYATYGDAP